MMITATNFNKLLKDNVQQRMSYLEVHCILNYLYLSCKCDKLNTIINTTTALCIQ